MSRVEENRGAARGWVAMRRACRVSLAQWVFIVRNTRVVNANRRHAKRTEAMLTMRDGIFRFPF